MTTTRPLDHARAARGFSCRAQLRTPVAEALCYPPRRCGQPAGQRL